MKKIIFICLFFLFLITGCNNKQENIDHNSNIDEQRLIINETEVFENDLKKYDLNESNSIIHINNYFELMQLMKTKDNSIRYFYFGKPTCPWCRSYLPYYNEYAELNNATIYYFNADNIKNWKEFKNPNGKWEIDLDDRYEGLVSYLLTNGGSKYMIDDSTEEIEANQLTGKHATQTFDWLFVPKLFAIKDGQIIASVKGLEDYEMIKDETNNYYLPNMSDEQIQELKRRLEEFFLIL